MVATLNLSPLVLATPTSTIPITHHEPITMSKDYSFPSVSSLKNCKYLDEIKQLHCHILKQGVNNKISHITNIISTCSQMGTSESMKYAQNAFDLFRKDKETTGTLFMYNSLIRGYSSIGLCLEAILLYLELLGFGMSPDKFTFPFVLSACAKSLAFREGIQVHGSVVKMGFEEDVFIQNSLIHFYSECGEIDYGRKVFDKMTGRNVVSWTSLICSYARRGYPKEAIDLFFKMVDEEIRPNSVTMVCVISACAKLQDLELGDKICAYIDKWGMKVNTLMVNALVDMYMKCGAVDKAKRLFDDCEDKNLVLCNTIMSNYARIGLAQESLEILGKLLLHGLRPDRVTMLSAISASSQLGDILFGKMCHGFVLRHGLESWDSICNAMIDMYMKCDKQETAHRIFTGMSNKNVVSWNSLIAGYFRNGDLELAWEAFNKMPERDLVSWNTILGGLVQESLFDEVVELFRMMQSEEVQADRVTMMEVASACGYLGALNLAKWIYAYLEKNNDGICCDMRLGTALVDMFARCGDFNSAMQVFNKMEKKDVSAWSAGIGAMAMEGNSEQAVRLFNEMLEQGVKPDGILFVGVLTACSHGGYVEVGRRIFRSMMETHKISPQIVHYGCMVDLLGRAGLLEEALDLIKSMPMEGNDVIWGSLLAACRTHRHVNIATYAAERIAELAPEKVGTHVLLSNIYAAAGKWNHVAEVRLAMKDKGIRKVPGSSSIEVNGQVNEFTSGDESHPENARIFSMLQEINCKLRHLGYVPILSNVLLDVDDGEKEHLLSRHSEKLAMAFGLISTSRGIPIRIVKNLRMCSDCHSFAKLVSKVYNREIIVRDNNRFHFFHQGSCSCRDYW